MKNLMSMVLAGSIGGLVMLGGTAILNPPKQTIDPEPSYARAVNLNFPESSAPSDFIYAAEKAMPAVVHIKAEETERSAYERYQRQNDRYQSPFGFFDWLPFGGIRPQRGIGSGVIIRQDGYIVTNNHVIDFADHITVTLHDDRKFKARLVGKDPRTDLAVIKIDSRELKTLPLGSSSKVRVGEWVLAVGNPFDLTSTVTAGIVSAKGRDNIIRNDNAIEDFIQTDAAVNPGNSGGALVNMQGELIGINTAIATPTGTYAGYSFAIPADLLDNVVENIIAYGGPRGRLGVSIATVKDYEQYYEVRLKANEGLVVTEIEQGSAAQYAGILPSDVITGIDGINVNATEDLIQILEDKKIGEPVQITINRDGVTKSIRVTLKS